MGRSEKLRAMVNVKGRGLEIGPSHAPVFPKREGFWVETVDYASADDLRLKYDGLGVDVDAIEEVDYVSDGRPLHEVVPHEHAYDYIFSSHAIEQVSDFVGYIQSCERLLKPDGVIAFAVPDKRYTFDILQTITSTGRVLEAFARGQSRHSPAAVYDFFANTVFLGGNATWGRASTGALTFCNDPLVGKPPFDDAMKPDGPYHDVHAWIFTPNSFRLIISDLRALGLIQVDEEYMAEEGALEFHIALRAGARGHGLDRVALSKFVTYDQVSCGARALATDFPLMSEVHVLLNDPAAMVADEPVSATESALDIEPVKTRTATDRLVRQMYKAVISR